jgi:hypothetical protein
VTRPRLFVGPKGKKTQGGKAVVGVQGRAKSARRTRSSGAVVVSEH